MNSRLNRVCVVAAVAIVSLLAVLLLPGGERSFADQDADEEVGGRAGGVPVSVSVDHEMEAGDEVTVNVYLDDVPLAGVVKILYDVSSLGGHTPGEVFEVAPSEDHTTHQTASFKLKVKQGFNERCIVRIGAEASGSSIQPSDLPVARLIINPHSAAPAAGDAGSAAPAADAGGVPVSVHVSKDHLAPGETTDLTFDVSGDPSGDITMLPTFDLDVDAADVFENWTATIEAFPRSTGPTPWYAPVKLEVRDDFAKRCVVTMSAKSMFGHLPPNEEKQIHLNSTNNED